MGVLKRKFVRCHYCRMDQVNENSRKVSKHEVELQEMRGQWVAHDRTMHVCKQSASVLPLLVMFLFIACFWHPKLETCFSSLLHSRVNTFYGQYFIPMLHLGGVRSKLLFMGCFSYANQVSCTLIECVTFYVNKMVQYRSSNIFAGKCRIFYCRINMHLSTHILFYYLVAELSGLLSTKVTPSDISLSFPSVVALQQHSDTLKDSVLQLTRVSWSHLVLGK